MEKNEVIILGDRGFIQANGPEIKDFLQNIVTNDIEKITNDSTIFSSSFFSLIIDILQFFMPISLFVRFPSIKQVPFFIMRSNIY